MVDEARRAAVDKNGTGLFMIEVSVLYPNTVGNRLDIPITSTCTCGWSSRSSGSVQRQGVDRPPGTPTSSLDRR
jgi:hypothetical protein